MTILPPHSPAVRTPAGEAAPNPPTYAGGIYQAKKEEKEIEMPMIENQILGGAVVGRASAGPSAIEKAGMLDKIQSKVTENNAQLQHLLGRLDALRDRTTGPGGNEACGDQAREEMDAPVDCQVDEIRDSLLRQTATLNAIRGTISDLERL